MKAVAEAIGQLTQEDIAKLENDGDFLLANHHLINLTDVEIIAEDVPGWQVANLGKLTVALDITITDELKQEGVSRELVSIIQGLRKKNGLYVTDKISVRIRCGQAVWEAVNNNLSYICAEILAERIALDDKLSEGELVEIDGNEILIAISKV